MIPIPRLIMDDGHQKQSPLVSIVSTTPEHIAYLKKNLRPEDEAEILRFGVTISKALWFSYKHSLIRRTALIDGIVAACWGVVGAPFGSKGQVWLMTTPTVKRVSPLRFCRIYQEESLKMLKLFPLLENYVDPAYDSAIRLLDICGFTIDNPEQVGTATGRRFWKEK